MPIHFGTALTGFRLDHDRAVANLDDGREVSADWIVAADGVSSPLRRQWIGDRPQGLGLEALVGDSTSAVDHPLLTGGYFMSLGDRGNSVFCYREQGGVHLSYTRRAAEQFHHTSRPRQLMRDLGFLMANTFIALGRRFSRKR